MLTRKFPVALRKTLRHHAANVDREPQVLGRAHLLFPLRAYPTGSAIPPHPRTGARRTLRTTQTNPLLLPRTRIPRHTPFIHTHARLPFPIPIPLIGYVGRSDHGWEVGRRVVWVGR